MDLDDDAIETWCNDHLPDIYDEGMFDDEETHEDVWDAFQTVAADTLLDHIDDDDSREELTDALTEAAAEWFRAHHAALIEAIPTAPAATLKSLQEKPQVAQHSAEWYAQRRNRLTASEFAQILDGRRGALLRSKVAPPDPEMQERPIAAPVAIAQEDGEMRPTSWGHRFETIVRRVYELEFAGVGTVCDTLGRFTHRDIPWLSASPDGIVLEGPLAGRLVEIKSPKSRQPGEFVPHEYYVQMQIQMEVTDLDAVDFVEAQFGQRPDEAITPADEQAIAAAAWKGRIQVFGHLENPETWVYRYSEPVEDLEDAVLPPPPADLPLLENSVWWLTGWFPRTVLRNRHWWSSVGWPAASAFWADVEAARVSPTPPAASASSAATPSAGGWAGLR